MVLIYPSYGLYSNFPMGLFIYNHLPLEYLFKNIVASFNTAMAKLSKNLEINARIHERNSHFLNPRNGIEAANGIATFEVNNTEIREYLLQ